MRNLLIVSFFLFSTISYADDVRDLLEVIESGVTAGDVTCADPEPVAQTEVPSSRRCSVGLIHRPEGTKASLKKGGSSGEWLPFSRIQEIKDRLKALVESGECVLDPIGECRIEPYASQEVVVKVGRASSYVGSATDISAARANMQMMVDHGFCTLRPVTDLPACGLYLYDNGELRLIHAAGSSVLYRNPTREQATAARERMTLFRENNICGQPATECRLNRFHSCRFSTTAPECTEGILMLEMNEEAVFAGTPEEMKARAAVIADLGLCTLGEDVR